MHPDLKKFFEQSHLQNRICFLTGQRNFDSLLETARKHKAIQLIVSEMVKERVSANDPQMIQALDIMDKIQGQFLMSVKETFNTLQFPNKNGLASAEFLMMFTGIRKGELRHLEWSDVDLKTRLLHVRPKDTWGPKTENSSRTIPLCDPAVEALKMAWERNEKRKEKSTLVFPGRKGGHLTDIRGGLNGACDRAGVPPIRVHGLRHTFGSQMAMAGADPFAIMKAMGHADIKTTMIYVSLGKSHIREQVERLNQIAIN